MPKTPAGYRRVTLLPSAQEALRNERLVQGHTAGRVWRHPSTGLAYRRGAEIRHLWRRLLRAAGVRYRPPYQLRHTYASLMLTAGEDPSWIAAQMGHSDWAMIRRVYARWIPEARPGMGRRGGELLATVFSQAHRRPTNNTLTGQ